MPMRTRVLQRLVVVLQFWFLGCGNFLFKLAAIETVVEQMD